MANSKISKPISHFDRLNNPDYVQDVKCNFRSVSMPVREETLTDSGIIVTKTKYKVYKPSDMLSKFKFHDFDLIKLQRSGAIDNLKPTSFQHDSFTATSQLTSQLAEFENSNNKNE